MWFCTIIHKENITRKCDALSFASFFNRLGKRFLSVLQFSTGWDSDSCSSSVVKVGYGVGNNSCPFVVSRSWETISADRLLPISTTIRPTHKIISAIRAISMSCLLLLFCFVMFLYPISVNNFCALMALSGRSAFV